MSAIHKKGILICFAIAGVVALLFPVLFGAHPDVASRQGEDSWRNFVYDFQTLIGGALAVFAAYLTIRAGLQLDERQEDRHRQMMSFTTRNELRTLERAINPQLQEIGEIVQNLWQLEHDPEDVHESENWTWFTMICEMHISDVRQLEYVINREQFTDALPFFDGRLSRAYSVFEESSRNLTRYMNEHMDALEAMQFGRSYGSYEYEWSEYHAFTVGRAEKYRDSADIFYAELLRTRDEYRTLVARYGR